MHIKVVWVLSTFMLLMTSPDILLRLPRWRSSWGQHGAPYWPHEPCYRGRYVSRYASYCEAPVSLHPYRLPMYSQHKKKQLCNFGSFFAVRLINLNKQSSGRWNETPYSSCNVTFMCVWYTPPNVRSTGYISNRGTGRKYFCSQNVSIFLW